MRYIASFSGGVASAVATDRAIGRFGRENVTIWIADTMAEDPDLWRFVEDCMKKWGGRLEVFRDGRNPLSVFEDKHIIPNNALAPCTFLLKIDPFVKFLKNCEKPLTVLLGLNWDERHRMQAPRKRYEAIEGVSVEYPLLWKPYILDSFSEVRSWGIEVPNLYKLGFSHNNCAGACVKQGQGGWVRLMKTNYLLFKKYRDWETHHRQKVGDYAFLREMRNGVLFPLPLSELERRNGVVGDAVQEDLFGCFCSY